MPKPPPVLTHFAVALPVDIADLQSVPITRTLVLATKASASVQGILWGNFLGALQLEAGMLPEELSHFLNDRSVEV